MNLEQIKQTAVYKRYKDSLADHPEMRKTILSHLEALADHPNLRWDSLNARDLNIAFLWRTTPQGHDFWRAILLGRFEL